MSREPQGPRTEAGRRLMETLDRAGYAMGALLDRILAIEDEAATPAPGPRETADTILADLLTVTEAHWSEAYATPTEREVVARARRLSGTTEPPRETPCPICGLVPDRGNCGCSGAAGTTEPPRETERIKAAVARAHEIAPALEWLAERESAGTTEPPRDGRDEALRIALDWLSRYNADEGDAATFSQMTEVLALGAAGTTEPPPRDYEGRITNRLARWAAPPDGREAWACSEGHCDLRFATRADIENHWREHDREDAGVADGREALRERVIEAARDLANLYAPIGENDIWHLRSAVDALDSATAGERE